jgi:ubiquinone biosynthesis protein COQ4
MKRLINDPEQTHEVFIIVEALSGNSLGRSFKRFQRTPIGHEVLRMQRNLLDTLSDRDALRALPPDSLGRTYLAFMESEDLSADGLVDASTARVPTNDPDLARYAARLRDMHDLMHVSTGYGRDTFGELCLLAFTFAQTRNPGIGFIVLMGAAKLARQAGPNVLATVWRAYRAGRRANWLPAEDWESLLARPLDEVRQELGISPPSDYLAMRKQWATA